MARSSGWRIDSRASTGRPMRQIEEPSMAGKKALGKEYPDTLTSIYYLSYLPNGQKEYGALSDSNHNVSFGYSKILDLNYTATITYDKPYFNIIQEMEQ
jgi:hypothetical protein